MPKKSTASSAAGAKAVGKTTVSAKGVAPKSGQDVNGNFRTGFANLVIVSDFGDDVAHAQVEMRFRNVAEWIREEHAQPSLLPKSIALPKAVPTLPTAVMHVNDVPFGNVDYTAYALYCCYRALGRSRPNLFIYACEPGMGQTSQPCVLQTDFGNTLVGPNNGALGLLQKYFEEREIPTTLWQLDIDKLEELEQRRMEELTYHIPRTFHGRDLYAVSAGLLAGGVPLKAIATQKQTSGLTQTNFAEKLAPLPLKIGESITTFAFRDNTYGNLKTNLVLDALMFGQLIDEDAVFRVQPHRQGWWPKTLTFAAKRAFGEVGHKKGVLLLGSTFAPEWDTRLVELAINMGNVSQYLGLPRSYSGAVNLELTRLR